MLINYLVKESVIIQPENLWTRKQSITARLINKKMLKISQKGNRLIRFYL